MRSGIFTAHDHARLATLFQGVPGPACKRCGGDGMQLSEVSLSGECRCGTCLGRGYTELVPYAGYKPTVREAPNGDTKACPLGHKPGDRVVCNTCHGSGRVPNVDAEGACGVCGGHGLGGLGTNAPKCPACHGSGRAPAKRYLHVAEKYLAKHPGLTFPREYLARAHFEACRVANALGVPAAYMPNVEDATLRVLEYPPGAGTVEHKDFDLFSIVCYRSTPEDLELTTGHMKATSAFDMHGEDRVEAARMIDPYVHIGEIGELVGLGPATPHRVPARPYAQQSIIYFAMPRHAAILPPHEGGITTVGEWLAERLARSRYNQE